ncbi:hypothetical protein Dimus_024410 [Dionaea muscipula]
MDLRSGGCRWWSLEAGGDTACYCSDLLRINTTSQNDSRSDKESNGAIKSGYHFIPIFDQRHEDLGFKTTLFWQLIIKTMCYAQVSHNIMRQPLSREVVINGRSSSLFISDHHVY